MKQQHSAQSAHMHRISPRVALVALVATLALAGCGGGGDTAPSSNTGQVSGDGGGTSPVTPAKVSLPEALANTNSYPQVINTSYLSVTPASASKASAAAASPAPTITPTELLNWAEAMFPTRFPAGAQNQTNGALTYRYYAAPDVYLGVANNVVYAFGSDTASQVVNAGNLGDFNCTVKPGSCTVIPVQAFTCDAAAITCVEVVSTAGANQSSVPVTFGQPFKAGDWKHATQGLIAKVDGTQIPLQSDEISSHRDGSARFAVLSAQLNNVVAGQTRIINLYTGSKTSSTPNVPSNPDWNLEIEAQLYDTNGNATETLIAQPQAQLVSQIANGTERRLAGAVASEYTVALPFKYKSTGAQHPHLTARLHTRLVDAGARIRTDMVVENTRTWTQAPGNITYSLAVKRNGSTLFTQPKFTHYHHARWHKVLWTGSSAEPQARVRHSMPYFVASKVVWNYDLSLEVSEPTLAGQYALLTQKQTEQAALGPMGNAMLEKYFPTTGGRPEIGPIPRWMATYLISQDARALEVMLANASAAAAAPIHYRDETSGQPADLDTYPNLALRFGTSIPPIPNTTDTTIWTPDQAHQASFGYIPYLVTGDVFFLDEMLFWSAWNLASPDPTYRKGGQAILESNEVRAMAWSIRSVWEASSISPDSHSLKNYFATRLQNNLSYLANKYQTSNKQISPMGMILSNQTGGGDAAPWQNDFVAIVMALIAEDGYTEASLITKWVTQFTVGRFSNESNGFCLEYAPGYYWKVKDSEGGYISSWSQLWDTNYPGVTCDSPLTMYGYPDSADGYAANARAMMAATANAGISGSKEAYTKWKSLTPKMDNALLIDPTWAIVPR